MNYEALKSSKIESIRAAIRANGYTSHTAGLGQGFLQANLVILSEEYALDFLRYCQRNPKPCPLIGVSDTGNPHLFTAGRDLDLRTDVPAYNVYRGGTLERCVNDIHDLWRDDMVAFAIGCSFTFEDALIKAGIDLWHITNDTTVPMFRTNVETFPAGPFRGPIVVSLRMVPDDKVDLVRSISARFPLAHGSPIHWGDPAKIGIDNLAAPDWGDPVPVLPNYTPMFWACGVTPQAAIENAALPLCITHKPGHMLITDIPDTAEIPILQ
ncbi:putative hydro-lyase [Brucella anthropi]|uniref:putative hydro-lyase n=1 Tax=Brucella anthropi TaxID=529 RepID=UPI00244A807C|nr:putative hydro-lyase [Brucella anthropi]MDG9793550.1 putative hydro-lyase [Brucella anthropi]MDH0583383.1 putative hydro-lyase [Brucella anthropi]MDH0819950.1 putative hydro-lyase [Brucella anthropi]MDH2086775.1 putative hydro-lyase [Brucella anthropi]